MITDRRKLASIQAEIDAAGHGAKNAIKLRIAGELGISKCTLERSLAKFRGKRIKLTRPVVVPEKLIDELIYIKGEAAAYDRNLSTEDCIDIMRKRGIEGADKLTVSTANTRLAKRGWRERGAAARPIYKNIEHAYANELWQMDFSPSEYFRVAGIDDNGQYILEVSPRPLSYKENNKLRRFEWVSVVDAYSRINDIRGFISAGESFDVGLAMLTHVWNRAEDDPHPLKYKPDKLQTDNGPFRKSKYTEELIVNALGIEMPGVSPGSHNTQGKVENTFRVLWHKFELKHAVELGRGRRVTESWLNEQAAAYVLQRMKKKHPRIIGKTRVQAYAHSVLMRQAELLDGIDLLRLAYRPIECKVPDNLIVYVNVDGQRRGFEAPAFAHDKYIRIFPNLRGECMAVCIDEHHKPFVLTPPPEGDLYVSRQHGDYSHAAGKTLAQREADKAEQRQRQERTGNRAKPVMAGKNVMAMGAREKQAEVSSVFNAMSQPNSFNSANEARLWVGVQIKLMTDQQLGYDDFADVFDPVINDTLEKAPIKNHVERFRKAWARERMTIAGGSND